MIFNIVLIRFYGIGSILPGSTRTQRTEEFRWILGRRRKILVVVDPATGAKSKEFVVWVNRISEVLNNDGRKRITWIGGKLIRKSFCNIFQLNYYQFVESWPPYQHSFIPPEKKGKGCLKILGHVL